jgi:dTDP-4-amino-4,6-dideoxygalactose transaminase
VIRFQRPSFPEPEAIEQYMELAREKRWFSNFGPCYSLLRERLGDAVGCHAIPVANGMLGLMASAASLARRSPKAATEALVPSFAFAASAQAAVWNGLEPVFIDVDATHWHMSPVCLEEALAQRSGRVAIVIALSSFGTPPPPDVRKRWERACRESAVPLLIDSAAGFGGVAADGTPIGAQGDIEVVSFHAVKPLAIGEGGAIFTCDPELADELTRVIDFGFDRARDVTMSHGLNAKLSEPAAAIGLAALDAFASHLAARRDAAQRVLRALPEEFESQIGNQNGTWQFVPVKAPSAACRASVLGAAQGKMELRCYYRPLHLMSAFVNAARIGELPVTEELGRRMLSLPMADDLTEDEMDSIVAVVRGGAVLGSSM